MKKLIILLPVLLASCSPRIVTTIIQQPALSEHQNVTIYKNREQVPDGYQLLGTVNVGDAGSTINCDSLRMINLVKSESRKIGGNAVLITEHKRPSFWGSNCHQFKGLVLNIPNIEPTEERNTDLEAAALSLLKQWALPRFTFSGNIGQSFRTNEIASDLGDFQRDFYDELLSGIQTNISADYFFSSHCGIRLAYQNFYSSHSELATNGYITGNLEGKNSINTVCPAFVVRWSTPKLKWLFDCSFGFGYIHLTDKFVFPDNTFREITGSTLCTQFTLGIAYRFTENWSIGYGGSSTTGALSKVKMNRNGYVETVKFENNQMEGLDHISVLFGLKYHIK